MLQDSSHEFEMNCPLPITDYPQVLLAHGGGGTLMHRLLEDMILPAFENPLQEKQHRGPPSLEIESGLQGQVLPDHQAGHHHPPGPVKPPVQPPHQGQQDRQEGKNPGALESHHPAFLARYQARIVASRASLLEAN